MAMLNERQRRAIESATTEAEKVRKAAAVISGNARPKKSERRPTPLRCCICGNGAGRFQQHWNRDTGWGICPICVAEQAASETPEVMRSYYGLPGVNYDQPMVHHMGRRYRVLAATKREAQANAFMARTPGAAVLTVFDDGTIVIADQDDQGEPIDAGGQDERAG